MPSKSKMWKVINTGLGGNAAGRSHASGGSGVSYTNGGIIYGALRFVGSNAQIVLDSASQIVVGTQSLVTILGQYFVSTAGSVINGALTFSAAAGFIVLQSMDQIRIGDDPLSGILAYLFSNRRPVPYGPDEDKFVYVTDTAYVNGGRMPQLLSDQYPYTEHVFHRRDLDEYILTKLAYEGLTPSPSTGKITYSGILQPLDTTSGLRTGGSWGALSGITDYSGTDLSNFFLGVTNASMLYYTKSICDSMFATLSYITNTFYTKQYCDTNFVESTELAQYAKLSTNNTFTGVNTFWNVIMRDSNVFSVQNLSAIRIRTAQSGVMSFPSRINGFLCTGSNTNCNLASGGITRVITCGIVPLRAMYIRFVITPTIASQGLHRGKNCAMGHMWIYNNGDTSSEEARKISQSWPTFDICFDETGNVNMSAYIHPRSPNSFYLHVNDSTMPSTYDVRIYPIWVDGTDY